MTPPLLEQYSLLLMDIERNPSKMDAAFSQNNTVRTPMPVSKLLLGPLVAVVSKFTSAVFSLNVTLGRKTTIVPGMSDRAIARLSRGLHPEDVIHWNVLAHQYGGMRIVR